MIRKLNFLFALVLTAILFVSCLYAGKVDPEPGKADPKSEIGEKINKFAFDLYDNLKSGEGNLAFSPASISTALAMTYTGAKGRTASEMSEVLHFNMSPIDLSKAERQFQEDLLISQGNDCELFIANSIWPQSGYQFLPAFTRTLKDDYNSVFTPLDYKRDPEGARKIINQWVEKETRDKIKNLIGKGFLSPLTRMVLVNAIYFKADWKSQFKPKMTKELPFKLISGKKIKTKMMSQIARFPYTETDEFQILEMPYKGGEMVMDIFLPKSDGDGLMNFDKSFTYAKFASAVKAVRPARVAVLVPKFKVNQSFSLAEVLKKMGMPDAFNDVKADFSGMTKEPELFISAVIHKAFVGVDEKGTEAAAATAVIMDKKYSKRPRRRSIVFRADRPFFYVIRDRNSGAILFMGKLVNPKD